MKRPATKIVVAAAAFGVGMIVLASVRLSTPRDLRTDDTPCGAEFLRRGTRCCPPSTLADAEAVAECSAAPTSCPAPLILTPRGCDAPEHSVIRLLATTVSIGPSDWEAEGRVRPRTVHAEAFGIDRFEVTRGSLRDGPDPGRAASELSLHEARAICKARGGRLPTEDEWIVAAAGEGPRRYPWGDTGAVCRRAAWGLARGPCASGATGPDTVGAHPDGMTPQGIHDLAGNVDEWVETGACPAGAPPDCQGVVRGGSFATSLATDLRTWVRREVPASSHDPTIGVRCAYE